MTRPVGSEGRFCSAPTAHTPSRARQQQQMKASSHANVHVCWQCPHKRAAAVGMQAARAPLFKQPARGPTQKHKSHGCTQLKAKQQCGPTTPHPSCCNHQVRQPATRGSVPGTDGASPSIQRVSCCPITSTHPPTSSVKGVSSSGMFYMQTARTFGPRAAGLRKVTPPGRPGGQSERAMQVHCAGRGPAHTHTHTSAFTVHCTGSAATAKYM